MNRITKRMRQKQYGDIYTFEFRRQPDGHYEIYAFDLPDNPFEVSVTKCHLYPDCEVCVRVGREPRTLDRAIAITTYFMDGYSKYCRTGIFPSGSRRVTV